MPYIEHEGALRELPLGRTIVGGAPLADWYLPLAMIAPRHLVLTVDPAGGVLAAPYAPNRAVRLNGQSLAAPAALRDGDTLELGRARLVYLAQL
jgi:pSer/pThr/pTyr-binding forkhead associated (FHA) protein